MSAAQAVAGPTLITTDPGRARIFWQNFASNRGALIGLILVGLIILAALLAPFITLHSPIAQNREAFLLPPVWQKGGTIDYLLGTDGVGRDLFARLVYGARLSLTIGVVCVSIAMVIGVPIGLISGFWQGWLDAVLMRGMDILLALPSLLLAIVVVAILGPDLSHAMIAVAITYVPLFARLTRGAVLTEKNQNYVLASRMAGASSFRLMLITILPNCLAPLIVQASLGLSSAILDAAALGFLGLGAQPPTPEWGTLLADAREYLIRAWWVITFPGLAILVTVVAFNLVGDGLRDALDPRLRR